MKAWTEQITNELSHLAQETKNLHKYIYINDANEKQDVFAGYEQDNVERMREVSRRYDPGRCFQTLGVGGRCKLGV
jgi:hypothetical protein